MKLNTIYKVRKFLEWVAKVDHQNTINEAYESIEGRRAKSLFEVLNNEHFLKEVIANDGEEVTKEQIKETFTTYKNSSYYL